MSASIFAAAARLLAASNNDDVIESSSEGHAAAIAALADAQREMAAHLDAAGVTVPRQRPRPTSDLHLSNPDGTMNKDFDAALLAGLTSKSEIERCFARAVASGLSNAVMDWATAEVERGTGSPVILAAMMEISSQQVASLAGNFLTPANRQTVLTEYHRLLDATFLRHAEIIANMLRKSAATS